MAGTAHGLQGRLMITLHGGKNLKVVQLVGKQVIKHHRLSKKNSKHEWL